MATIRELRTVFTAQAQGIKSVAQSVRSELQGIGDTSEKSVKKANTSFKDLDQSLNKLDKKLQQTGNTEGFESLNKVIREARTELVNTGKISEKSMGDLQSAVMDAKKHLSDLGDDGKTSLQGFETTLNQVDSQLKQFGKNSGLEQLNGDLTEASQGAGDLGKGLFEVSSPKMSGGLGAISAGIGGIATVALGAISAIAGLVTGLVGLITKGDELQKTFNKLEQQTGASKEEMQGMEESLRNIYKSGYGESFKDIADAMANVKQVTGLTGKELESATQQAILLRDSMGLEVNESVRTASVMMKNFGISSEEAFTLLAQGQQMGVNASDDMLDTFLEYSPLFKQLGFDAEDMLNVLNTGMQAGIRNSDVLADTVKEFGIRVKDGSKLTAESFDGLGLNADEMADKFAKGGDSAQEAFSQTMAAIAKIEDPLTRNTIGVGLFGTKFEDLEFEAVLALGNVEDVANKSADTLGKIDKLQFNSIGGAFAGMGRILQTELLMPIQDKMMPYLNSAANFLKDNLPVAIDATKNALRPLGDAFSTFKTILEPLFDIMKTSFQTFIDSMGPAWDSLKNLFNSLLPILQAVGAVVGGTLVTALGIAISAINGVISALGPIINAFINFADVVVNVVKAVIAVLTGDFSKAMDYWKQATESSIAVFQSLWEGVVNFFKTFVDSIISFFQNLYDVLVGHSIIPDLVNAITKWFQDLFTWVIEIVTNIVNGIIQWWTTAKTRTGEILGELITVVSEKFESVKQAVQEKMDLVKQEIEKWWDTAKTRTGEIIEGLKKVASDKFDSVKTAVSEKMGLVRDEVSNLWEEAKKKTDEWIGNIVKAAQGLPGKIGKGIKDFMEDATGAMADLAESLINKFKSALGINSPSTVFYDMAHWIIRGLTDGLNAENLKTLGKNVFSKFADGALNTLDKIKAFVTGDSINYSPSAGVQQWAPLATKALQMTGQYSEANLQRLLMQMDTESGGNPNSINLWDSNAKKGIPSKGLMQVIDPTFKSYAMPGYNTNVYDPLSNMLASIRYSLSRYGSLEKAWKGVGYEVGGIINNEQLALVGEGNKEEVIIPLEQFKSRALALLAYAAEKLGVLGNFNSHNLAGIDRNYKLPNISAASLMTTTNNSSTNGDTNINLYGDINVDSEDLDSMQKVIRVFERLPKTIRSK